MKFFKGFFYAGRGIIYALRGRNFRFMLCCAGLVIFFGIKFYSFDKAEWAALLLCCGLVLALEAFNTALEFLANNAPAERENLLGKAKDTAAGGVLTASIFSAVIGGVIFWDEERFSLIKEFFSEPARLSLLILALALMWCFVFLPEFFVPRKKD